ncbi:MAG: TIM barrel protein [Akkermansiaceae bacterium]
MLAFSTCWNNSRHTEGEEMIDEILDLGFDTLELSHGMTIAKLPGIKKAFAANKFKCVGVHNYFPSPTEVMIDAPDAFEFSSDNKSERDKAFRETLKTLDIAHDFGAYYVVLHMGSVATIVAGKSSAKVHDAYFGWKAKTSNAKKPTIATALKTSKFTTSPARFGASAIWISSVAKKPVKAGVRSSRKSPAKGILIQTLVSSANFVLSAARPPRGTKTNKKS